MQRGEVNVPGLGYFAQVKVDGYYDNVAGKFYPPSSKLSFDTQYHDDDVLLQYIANKKKISLASSKYFTAKYIDNLRLEAMQKEVQLADLGTLHFEDTKLTFKQAAVMPVDPAYYGYEPIAINKLGGTSFYEQLEKEQNGTTYIPQARKPEPVQAQAPMPTRQAQPTTEPKAEEQPEIFIPQPTYSTQQTVADEEEFIFHGRGYDGEPEEEETERNNSWIWITIVVVVVLGIIGLFALYEFKPGVFDHLHSTKPAPLELKTPLRHDTVKVTAPSLKSPDSGKNTIKVDTATAVHVAPPIDITPASTIDSSKVRFEVIALKANNIEEANRAVKNYNSIDINAHIAAGTKGRKFFVSLGTYSTHAEAMEAISKLEKTGKVPKGIWPLPINPNKK